MLLDAQLHHNNIAMLAQPLAFLTVIRFHKIIRHLTCRPRCHLLSCCTESDTS